MADIQPHSAGRASLCSFRLRGRRELRGDFFDLQSEGPLPAGRRVVPSQVHRVLGLVVVGFGSEELDGEVLQVGRVEIHDAGFDVVACVDERESVGCAVSEGVGVARAGFVENVGYCGEGLIFVGAADVLVGFDFSVKVVSLMFGPRGAC